MAVFEVPAQQRQFLPAATELGANNHLSALPTIVAQVDPEVDVLLQMQEAFNNFIDSGQVWALLIGFVLGYLFRSITG